MLERIELVEVAADAVDDAAAAAAVNNDVEEEEAEADMAAAAPTNEKSFIVDDVDVLVLVVVAMVVMVLGKLFPSRRRPCMAIAIGQELLLLFAASCMGRCCEDLPMEGCSQDGANFVAVGFVL